MTLSIQTSVHHTISLSQIRDEFAGPVVLATDKLLEISSLLITGHQSLSGILRPDFLGLFAISRVARLAASTAFGELLLDAAVVFLDASVDFLDSALMIKILVQSEVETIDWMTQIVCRTQGSGGLVNADFS